MAKFNMNAIKGNGKDSLSFGTSKDGLRRTITGTIVDCENVVKYRDEDGDVCQEDIGAHYFGVTCTVTVNQSTFDLIKAEVDDFFSSRFTQGIKDPRLSIAFSTLSALGKPVEGQHPTLGHKTLSVLVSSASYDGISDVSQDADMDMGTIKSLTKEAAGIATKQSSDARIRAKELNAAQAAQVKPPVKKLT